MCRVYPRKKKGESLCLEREHEWTAIVFELFLSIVRKYKNLRQLIFNKYQAPSVFWALL